MGIKNYYLVLGVPRDATGEGIRKAFRQRAQETHPDRAGTESTEAFQELRRAYETLSDPASRAEHDEALRRAERRSPPPRWRETGIRDVEPAPWGWDPYASRFGEPEPLLRRPPRGPGELEIVLSPGEARRGAVVALPVHVAAPCPVCRGTGFEWAWECSACGGGGEVLAQRTVRVRLPPGLRDGEWVKLPLSAGSGRAWAVIRLSPW